MLPVLRSPLYRAYFNRLSSLERLSEKGYKQRSEGGLGRYEEVEMGRKEPAGRSVGLCHGHLQDFSDSLGRGILRSWSIQGRGGRVLRPAEVRTRLAPRTANAAWIVVRPRTPRRAASRRTHSGGRIRTGDSVEALP